MASPAPRFGVDSQGAQNAGALGPCATAMMSGSGTPLLERCNEFKARLEDRFQVCCTALMAESKEKNRAKDIILWIITVALVALSIYWYQKPR